MVRYRETKEFFKMKFRVNEEDDEVIDEIKKLILSLKNDNFGNSEKRKEFVKIISQIALSNDPEARKVIKALGKFMTDYKVGDIEVEIDSDGNAELEIKSKKNEGKELMKKKIQFKSKHMREMYGDMMDELGYEVEPMGDDLIDDTFEDDTFEDDVLVDDTFDDVDEFEDDFSDDEEDIFSDDDEEFISDDDEEFISDEFDSEDDFDTEEDFF